MIQVNHTSFTYENSVNGAAVLDLNARIPKGQAVLLCGESGSGKTTFGRLVNGLIPSYYEGELDGNVMVNNKETSKVELHELAPYVGSVFQNPKSQFYTLLTDTEIVFACENMGMEKADILARFDRVVASLHIENLLGKSLFCLSGGEKQKIACASAGMLLPDIFVLDEPSSNLDIKTIQDLRTILLSWKAEGKTILIAEHRLAWLRGVVDRVLFFQTGKIVEDLKAEAFWDKPTKTLHNMGLRAPIAFAPGCVINPKTTDDYLALKDFRCVLKGKKILDLHDLRIPKGAVVAVLGNNGAGKTTFARCLCGLMKKASGTLRYNGKIYGNKQRIGLCYMVMQDVGHQLFCETVMDEVLLGMDMQKENWEAAGESILADLDLLDYKDAHPMSLSGGQRQRVAIAGAIASHKEIIVFDEPTSGLDYRHMQEVAKSIYKLADMGKTQFIITHDPELVAACCDYFIFMDSGGVVQSGSWDVEKRKYVSDYFKASAHKTARAGSVRRGLNGI